MKLLSEDIRVDPRTQIVTCISKITMPVGIFNHDRMHEKSYWRGGGHEPVACIIHDKHKIPSVLKDRTFEAPEFLYNERDFISSTVNIVQKGNVMERLESVKLKSGECNLSHAKISCGFE